MIFSLAATQYLHGQLMKDRLAWMHLKTKSRESVDAIHENRSLGLASLITLFFCSFIFLLSYATAQELPDYEKHIQPLLRNLCYDCHGEGAREGGLEFDAHTTTENLIADQNLWGKVWGNVLTETMPPADSKQPSPAERKMLSHWIARKVFHLDPTPGGKRSAQARRVSYKCASN